LTFPRGGLSLLHAAHARIYALGQGKIGMKASIHMKNTMIL